MYLTHFAGDGIHGITDTTDRSGKLRLTRTGNQITGYYFGPSNWVPIHTGPTETGDDIIGIFSWSHDINFANQDVRVAFDNFVIEEGELICPEPTGTVLDVPLFKQDDERWEGDEYAGGSGDELRCGNTMRTCGCATTSSAMILRYHGVERGPNGEPVNPKTLNNYLKEEGKQGLCNINGTWVRGIVSKGYSCGNISWPQVGIYSALAFENKFSSTKIQWIPPFEAYDEETVRSEIEDLTNPSILWNTAKTHWFVANGTTDSTLYIKDPLFNRFTLDDPAYGNSAIQMRRFHKVQSDFSTFQIGAIAPSHVLITDSEGRKTGYDSATGEVLTEIPSSYYQFEPYLADSTGVLPPPPEGEGINWLTISTPEKGTYTIEAIAQPNDLYSFTVYTTDISADSDHFPFYVTTPPTETHTYTFSYNPEPQETQLVRHIPIEVRPNKAPNKVICNLPDRFVSVAILTTETFNPAEDIDTDTVMFEGASPDLNHFGKGKPPYYFKDVDGNGMDDMIFYFKHKNTTLTCTSTTGTLIAKTKDGLDLEGSDEIEMIEK